VMPQATRSQFAHSSCRRVHVGQCRQILVAPNGLFGLNSPMLF
jgi:hypothetical protein